MSYRAFAVYITRTTTMAVSTSAVCQSPKFAPLRPCDLEK
jgi:hypothetical protein